MSSRFFDKFEEETIIDDELVQEYHRLGYWGDMACVDYLDWHADRRGDQPAVVDDDRTLTWRELRDEVDSVATWLRERGIARGDRVAYQVPHQAEWYVARLGIARAGAIAVSMIPRFREEEMTSILTRTEAKAYIGPAAYKDYEHIDIARSLRNDLDSLETVIAIGGKGGDDVTPFETLLDTDSDGYEPKRIDPDYPDTLSTTSGTTGMPKIYYLQQNSRLAMAKDMIGRYSVTKYDENLVFAPIQQATGELWAYYVPLVSGATVNVTRAESPEDQWGTIGSRQPSFCVAIPTQMTKMMNADESDQYSLDFVRVFTNAGAPLPAETARFFEDKGTVTANFYGASDGGLNHGICPMDPEEIRFSTVGKPVMSMETKIVNADGEAVPFGEVGEVIWRGGNQCFGYFDDRERTEETFDVGGPNEGWFHSGDAGMLDEDGNLAIVGRMDDMIIRGGQNIYPAEIQETLMEHEAVAEAALVGMPDPEYGERVCAYVVPIGAAQPTLDDLTTFLDEQGLAKFKWPERLELLNELPRSPGGKIQKTELKNDIEQKLSQEGVID